MISGVERKMNNHAGVLSEVVEKKIPIYVISYPATIHTSYLQLASYGSDSGSPFRKCFRRSHMKS